MYKHILIPTDGSDLSNKATRDAIALAKTINAKVTGMTVTIPFHVFTTDPAMITDTEDFTRSARARSATKIPETGENAAAAEGVACAAIHAEQEHPYSAIIDAANKNGCDLIAMASHGRHGLAAVVLGSETVKVLTHSIVPVLVYR